MDLHQPVVGPSIPVDLARVGDFRATIQREATMRPHPKGLEEEPEFGSGHGTGRLGYYIMPKYREGPNAIRLEALDAEGR